MRLESLRIKGLGPFRDEVTLDLSAVDGQVVAVHGPNGAGKTTLSEMWPAVMYREAPTRGKLAQLATERQAYVQATVVNGQRWTLRQMADAVSGKGESLVLDAAGQPVLADTKLKSFDAWAAAHLPSPEVFFASQFAAQGSGGLLAMSKGERKAVVLRALGIEYLEGLADGARERTRAVSAQRDTLLARIDDEQLRAGDVAELREECAALRAGVENVRAELQAAEAELAQARQEAERCAVAKAAHDAELAKRRALQSTLAELETELQGVDTRLQNNHQLLDGAEQIRQAVADQERLRGELEQARAAHAEARSEARAARERMEQLTQSTRTLAQRQADSATRIQALQQALADKSRVLDAARRLPELQSANDAAEKRCAELEAELRAAREARIAGADERIAGLRHGLTDIAEHGNEASIDPAAIAAATLRSDDETQAAAQAVPQRIAELERALLSAQRQAEAARSELRSWQRLADRADEMARAEVSLQQEQVQAQTDAEALADAMRRLEEAGSADAAAQGETDAEARIAELQRQLEAAAKLAGRAERLAQAEARIAELQQQYEALRSRIATCEQDLRDTPEPAHPRPAPAVSPFESSVTGLREQLDAAQADLAKAEARLETAAAASGRLEQLRAALTGVDSDLADWSRLAADLGRDGLQAVEIDAAGPQITDLTNELLHSAFGSRFTVQFETTRRSADGKKEVEDFLITVLDTERGREADAKTLSGGEGVIISEALSLALTVLACQRSGAERPTLVRDESGAALDAEKSEQYVAMLRRAARILDAQVLFVSHNPATWELADARITVAGGRIRVG